MSLSWRGKPSPREDQVGGGGHDGGDRPLHSLLGPVKTERRRLRPGDAQARGSQAERLSRFARHPVGPAEKEHRPSVGGGRRAQGEHQGGAGNAFRQGLAAGPRRPDERHAVRDDQRPSGYELGQAGLPG